MTFAEWLAAVDQILVGAIGIGYRDLPDGPWADYHGDEMTPAEALDAYAADWDDTGMLAELIA